MVEREDIWREEGAMMGEYPKREPVKKGEKGETKGTSKRGEEASLLWQGVMLWRVQQWSDFQRLLFCVHLVIFHFD